MRDKHTISSILPLCLYVLLWICFHSLYHYNIDPDTAACLQITDDYAHGQFWDAINGLWSPLQCWLVAGIQYVTKLNTLQATHGFNFILGLLFITRMRKIAQQWTLPHDSQLILNISFAIFLFYAAHAQLFGDLLLSYFLLVYLQLTAKEGFLSSNSATFIAGLIIGVSTLSKSYAFYFGGLHFLCLLIYTHNYNFKNYKTFIPFILGIAICVIPWTFFIHEKYGIWHFSLAGLFNRSWLLNGTYQLKNSIHSFIIPYGNAIAHWQDPFWTEDHFSSALDSFYLLKKQIVRFLFAFWEFIQSATLLSWAYVLLFLQLAKQIISKNSTPLIPINTWSIAILCLPLGYLTIHVESRYLWPALAPTMLFCFSYLHQKSTLRDAFTIKASTFLLGLSFILFPIIYLKEHKNEGRELAQLAQHLPSNLNGKRIISNIDPNQGIMLAYWSKSQYCSPVGPIFKDSKWPHIAFTMGITYFIEFHDSSSVNHSKLLLTLNYSALKPVYQSAKLTIYQITH